MIFYHYDLDGFTHTEDDQSVFEGADFARLAGFGISNVNDTLQAAGWVMMLEYGHDVGDLLTVYRHLDGIERGLYVDVRDSSGGRAYTCLVKPRAWPQYYRIELLPIVYGRYAFNASWYLKQLVEKIDEMPSVGTPPVEPPGKPK